VVWSPRRSLDGGLVSQAVFRGWSGSTGTVLEGGLVLLAVFRGGLVIQTVFRGWSGYTGGL
jgi:hypothetical protein